MHARYPRTVLGYYVDMAQAARNKKPSEYGGRPGLIQRAEDGHLVLEAPEVLQKIYATDTADETSGNEVLNRVQAG